MRTIQYLAFCVLLTALSMPLLGCGSDSTTPGAPQANSAPVASAGPDQNVTTGTPVILDGSASVDADADLIEYTWVFVFTPAGSAATLSFSDIVNPTFTPDVDGAYVLGLAVSDGTAMSWADFVTITAASANSAPVANAGPDQNVITGSPVTLDASASTDANSDLLTYTWVFASKPAGSTATLSSVYTVNPNFTTDMDGVYVLSLVVSDGVLSSTMADNVTITAATTNSAPVANAGHDQNVVTGSPVTLDASASTDANGDLLTYTWVFVSKPAGSAATLTFTDIVNPNFVADMDGTYVLSVVLTDGALLSAADNVTITAKAAVATYVKTSTSYTGPYSNYLTTYTNDIYGRLIADRTDHNDNGVIYICGTYHYDSAGLLAYRDEDYMCDSVVEGSTTYIYDSNGNKSMVLRGIVNGSYYDAFIYTYDAGGVLTMSEGDYGFDGSIDFRNIYTYDAGGVLNTVEGVSIFDGSVMNRTYFTFDGNGNLLLERMDWDMDGIFDSTVSHTWVPL